NNAREYFASFDDRENESDNVPPWQQQSYPPAPLTPRDAAAGRGYSLPGPYDDSDASARNNYNNYSTFQSRADLPLSARGAGGDWEYPEPPRRRHGDAPPSGYVSSPSGPMTSASAFAGHQPARGPPPDLHWVMPDEAQRAPGRRRR
ncbi:hypothetical protein HK405_000649, partial [Cladochytrium tenue]